MVKKWHKWEKVMVRDTGGRKGGRRMGKGNGREKGGKG